MSLMDLYSSPPMNESFKELCFQCIESGLQCAKHKWNQPSIKVEYFEACQLTSLPDQTKPIVGNNISTLMKKDSKCLEPSSRNVVSKYFIENILKHTEEKQKTFSEGYEAVSLADLPRKKYARFREKKYICDVCDASFTMKQNIAAHLFVFHVQADGRMRKHEKTLFRCKECSQIFRSPAAADLHFKKKHQPKKGSTKAPSDCEECGKSFASAFQLREHIAIQHLKERNFKCDQCEQRFGRRGGLRRHIQMVHQNHLHKCPYEECDHPGYKCSKALTAHIRSVHTNVRPFVCGECEKAFVRKNDLKMHQLTHRKDIEFTCECGHRFRRQMYLKKHQKNCERYVTSVSTS